MSERLTADVAVIGAGFGGLGAALSLAEAGARVVVCEALAYPGGCASTFRRKGYRFEAGATLFSGFGPGQLFSHWIQAHRMPVSIDCIDPLVELRTPSWRLAVPRSRSELVARFAALPGAPRAALKGFFRLQQRVSDVLWGVLDRPELLPPWGARSVQTLLAGLPAALGLAAARESSAGSRFPPLAASLQVLPLLGRPLLELLRARGLLSFEPLMTYLDAVCQITVQCSASEAEAPLALAALDYWFRGTGHVRGGIGVLAHALLDAVRALGGNVRLACRVQGLSREGSHWKLETRRGPVRVRAVVANQLPHGVAQLLGVELRTLPQLMRQAREVETGWGACMLYMVARAPEGARPSAQHLELVADPQQAMTEGNHLFCSLSGALDLHRVPAGQRSLTVSTHVPLAELRTLTPEEQAARVEAIQQRMRATFARLAPEWDAGLVEVMTASPRTFQRFTRRAHGYVGGVPRRAGLHNYARLSPMEVMPGLYLVGDSSFPGQSTLATALGGQRTAQLVLRKMVRGRIRSKKHIDKN